jgi:hypothetical protein
MLLLILGGSVSVRSALSEYPFVQLDPFFEKDLFGVKFDYNRDIAPDQALSLKSDLINQTNFSNTTDPNLNEDNYINIIGHKTLDINSLIFIVENIKRTQDLPIIGTVEWQSILPYVKILHQFDLSSGEHVILGQDFLGVALKLNGSDFNYDHYQLGYANIPIDFLEFLTGAYMNDKIVHHDMDKITDFDFSFHFPTNAQTSIKIQEALNFLDVEIAYSNLTYLFQTDSIDLDDIEGLNIADHIILVQFDSLIIKFNLRKYQNHGITGVETVTDFSIGQVNNLIINEKLPSDQSWEMSSEYKIEEKYKDMDILPSNSTFSWYTSSDIKKRLELFSDISLSFIFSQNLGILNNTLALDNLQLKIDNQNKTKEELLLDDLPVSDGFAILYKDFPLFSSPIGGRNLAILQDEFLRPISLISSEIKTIALDQHPGFSNKLLFLQETSLIREFVVEVIKRFISDPSLLSLTTDELITLTNMDLSSTYYKQDYQIKKWLGIPLKFSLIQYATKSVSGSILETEKNGIALVPILPTYIALFILTIRFKKQRFR